MDTSKYIANLEVRRKALQDAFNNPPEDNFFRNCHRHGKFDNRDELTPMGCESKGCCPRCIDEEWSKKLSKLRFDSCIPKRFKLAAFDSYIAKTNEQREALDACQTYATAVREGSDGSLVLLGNVGTGKTHLGVAIANDLLKRGISAEYITVRDMIRYVRSTWTSNSELSESQVIDNLLSPKLLIVDEVGVQSGSSSEMNILFDIFDFRYRECRPTVVISNLEPDKFKLALGERIVDRLRDHGRVLQFFWESHRRQASVEAAA